MTMVKKKMQMEQRFRDCCTSSALYHETGGDWSIAGEKCDENARACGKGVIMITTLRRIIKVRKKAYWPLTRKQIRSIAIKHPGYGRIGAR